MRLLSLLGIVCCIASILLASCESDKPPVAPAIKMRDSIPIMTSYGVSKLISDSGVIRYKVIAEEWKVYDRTNPPRQTFEKGLLLEKFNEKLRIQMYITADTAFWYNQNLWELRGRVMVWNDEGVRFNSELLYWDMDRHEFYSNKYSHLITPDREVKGNSFQSNEQMTLYEVNVSQATFPLPKTTATDTIPTDTAMTEKHSTKQVETVEKSEPLPPKGHFK